MSVKICLILAFLNFQCFNVQWWWYSLKVIFFHNLWLKPSKSKGKTIANASNTAQRDLKNKNYNLVLEEKLKLSFNRYLRIFEWNILALMWDFRPWKKRQFWKHQLYMLTCRGADVLLSVSQLCSHNQKALFIYLQTSGPLNAFFNLEPFFFRAKNLQKWLSSYRWSITNRVKLWCSTSVSE